jgi:hypothetical protein
MPSAVVQKPFATVEISFRTPCVIGLTLYAAEHADSTIPMQHGVPVGALTNRNEHIQSR